MSEKSKMKKRERKVIEKMKQVYKNVVLLCKRELPVLLPSPYFERWLKGMYDAKPEDGLKIEGLKLCGYNEKQFLLDLEDAFGSGYNLGNMSRIISNLLGNEEFVLSNEKQQYEVIKSEILNEFYPRIEQRNNKNHSMPYYDECYPSPGWPEIEKKQETKSLYMEHPGPLC